MNVWRRRAFKGVKGGFFMELEMYRRYSQMARGIEKAELVFKNGRVFSSGKENLLMVMWLLQMEL